MITLFAHKFVSDPHDSAMSEVLEDRHETWTELLNDPHVVAPDDEDAKEQAPAFCGARYFPEVRTRDRENVDCVTCLVLDVDCDDNPAGAVPDEEALRTALEGTRAIVYTSPSHTRQSPRWRVLLPLASPLPPKKHRALVEALSNRMVPGYAGCINVQATGDPCRLGFVGVTKHPEDYTWFATVGYLLDWTVFPLEDEEWISVPLGGLERSPRWTDRNTGLRSMLRSVSTVGQGIGPGQGRTDLLWQTANRAWWAYAAEDEDFVMEVLQAVNANFTVPEDIEELQRKLSESHKITIGERRKGQISGAYGWAREPSNTISRQAIQNHARILRQRRNPEQQAVGEALKRLEKGLTLSDEMDLWLGLTTKCCHEIARQWSSEDVDRLADFFAKSVGAMRAAGGLVSMDEVRSWIGARVEREKQRRAENDERADAKLRDQIEFVTSGERSTKYTKQEIDGWRASVGLRDNNWILVSKKAYFVFRNGTWVGPYTKEEFDAQGYKDLAAAAQSTGDFSGHLLRLQTFNAEKGTWTNVPLQKLLHDYGSKCKTSCDLNCESTWYNVDEHVLVMAGPPKRPLEPRFHENVDEWHRKMTGRYTPADMKVRQAEAAKCRLNDDYDILCDWLASVTCLDKPCAALYLHGAHSVGKGLFADGVSRIWKTGAIPLEDAFDNFNSLLAETPFIWVDEALPEHVRASVLLRKALAAREFVYKQKYMDAGKMTGCLRMLFTANNLNLFNKTKEIVKKEDVDALAKRFVHIHVRPEAADFLEQISPKHEAFVEENQIAEHALWLHEKRWAAIQKRGLRFLVAGLNTDVSDVVATNSDSTSACCSAICEALIGDASGRAVRLPHWIQVRDGDVWVNAKLLHQHLSLQMTNGKYTDREIAQSIESVAAGGSKPQHNPQLGKTIRARPVRLQSLRAWCDNAGVYEWSEVSAGIEKRNQETRAYAKAQEEAEKSAGVALARAVADLDVKNKIVN